MDSHDVLTDLDADQRRAVTTESRLVAVIAGAGSGKTRVLTRRIAYRIATDSADARHTLALTFTREALENCGDVFDISVSANASKPERSTRLR